MYLRVKLSAISLINHEKMCASEIEENPQILSVHDVFIINDYICIRGICHTANQTLTPGFLGTRKYRKEK